MKCVTIYLTGVPAPVLVAGTHEDLRYNLPWIYEYFVFYLSGKFSAIKFKRKEILSHRVLVNQHDEYISLWVISPRDDQPPGTYFYISRLTRWGQSSEWSIVLIVAIQVTPLHIAVSRVGHHPHWVSPTQPQSRIHLMNIFINLMTRERFHNMKQEVKML